MSEIKNKSLFEEEEELIQQDEKKGPGWFLIVSYIVIIIFCFYYLFTFWDYKTDYDQKNEKIQIEMFK